MNSYSALLDYIEELQIIDTHEHLPGSEALRPTYADVLSEWLTHYFSCDLISAGMPDEALEIARDPSQDILSRWEIVEPYWHAARSTGYGRSLDIAAHGLYGIDGVRRETIGALNEAFQAACSKGGHFQYVLKEKSRIALSVLDMDLMCDRNFFASVVQFDNFIMLSHPQDVDAISRSAGIPIHNLADLEEALKIRLDSALAHGAVALKSPIAYQRSLAFAKATRADAERDFNTFLAMRSNGWQSGTVVGAAFQDYMMHALLSLADARGLTFQFHTGLQEGNGNTLAHANPLHLTNLFLEYGNVKFDIFHMGYPYTMEVGALAKNFRNVYIDMCWGHIISPEAAQRALIEWLDAVPANKISAFGGDYCFVDGVYGHQYLARRNVAASLAYKVGQESFDLDRAKEIAHWVFIDNPTRLFNLTERLSPT